MNAITHITGLQNQILQKIFYLPTCMHKILNQRENTLKKHIDQQSAHNQIQWATKISTIHIIITLELYQQSNQHTDLTQPNNVHLIQCQSLALTGLHIAVQSVI